jgi:hypothetical protein
VLDVTLLHPFQVDTIFSKIKSAMLMVAAPSRVAQVIGQGLCTVDGKALLNDCMFSCACVIHKHDLGK